METAKQQAETVVNQAKAYQNAQIPKAEGQADQLIQNAEYLKQARINEATEQVAMFQAMYQEYQRNPEITRSRMYYEAFPGAARREAVHQHDKRRWGGYGPAPGELCRRRRTGHGTHNPTDRGRRLIR